MLSSRIMRVIKAAKIMIRLKVVVNTLTIILS